MKKKNGFIATSLIYSFFLVFITLFLTIIADYLQNKVLLNTIEGDIKQEINNTITIRDFNVGDMITFMFNYDGNCLDNENSTSTYNCNISSGSTFEVKDKFTVLGSEKENTILIENVDTNEKFYLKIDETKFTKPAGEVNNQGFSLGGVI